MQALPTTSSKRFGAIGLGANLPSDHGSPHDTLVLAIKLLENIVNIEAVSDLFATPAFPEGAGPDYVNGALSFTTDVDAQAILDGLQQIEAQIGRVRDTRWGARAADLDLLFLGDVVRPDAQGQTQWRTMPLVRQVASTPDRLILPHPRLQDRSFVLVPLAQVAPDWVHPLTGLSVIQMRDALHATDVATVRPVVLGA